MGHQKISLNSVHLVGNVGKDIEIRTLTSGIEVGSFSLATTYSVKKNDNWENITEWHNITTWTPNDNIKAIKKGEKVLVNGRITYDNYEKEGRKIYTTKIIANEIILFNQRSSEGSHYDPSNTVDNDF